MSNLKVLNITSYYLPAIEFGGPVMAISVLVEGIKKQGVDVEIFSTNARGEKDLEKIPEGKTNVNDVCVHFFNRQGLPRYFFSTGMTAALIKRIRELASHPIR